MLSILSLLDFITPSPGAAYYITANTYICNPYERTVMGKTYPYFMDLFRELPYSFQNILEAWEQDPLKPFKMVKSIIEREYGIIHDVRFHGSYFNPSSMTVIIEYMVEHSRGTTGVKIIHAENPAKALMEYNARKQV